MSDFRIVYKPRIRRSWDARNGRFVWGCGDGPPDRWGMGDCKISRERWGRACQWVQKRNLQELWPGLMYQAEQAAGGRQ